MDPRLCAFNILLRVQSSWSAMVSLEVSYYPDFFGTSRVKASEAELMQ
jgi:hypothetical protein